MALLRTSSTWLCDGSCAPRLDLSVADDGNPGWKVEVRYQRESAELIDAAAAELGTDRAGFQALSTRLMSYLASVATSQNQASAGDRPMPDAPDLGGEVETASVFTTAEIEGVDNLASYWSLQRDEAIKLATLLIGYLVLTV